MSTLAVVEAILREAAMPLSVREIVERAGEALPTKSKTPDTVVARDLSMDIKKRGDASTFTRTSPGRYAIREQAGVNRVVEAQPAGLVAPVPASNALGGPSPSAPSSISDGSTSLVGQSLPHDRNGTRAAPKPPKNSEDTPMSA